MPTITWTASGSWTVPAGVTQIDAQCWGEGGNGDAGKAGSGSFSAGGGGGGEYAEETALAVVAGANISFTIGGGGTGTATSFPGQSVTVTAHAGGNATNTSHGVGGSGSANGIHWPGGNGGNGVSGSLKGGGGGGSSAGTGSAGAAGGNGSAGAGSGGTAPSGGGNGGDGAPSSSGPGNPGSVPGGGGGGGSTHTGTAGGAGATGQITITYTANTPGTATLAGAGALSASSLVFNPSAPAPWQPAAPGRAWLRRFGFGRRQVLPGRQVQTITAATTSLTGTGTLTAAGGAPAPVVVNQWANNYGQGTAFGSVTSGLQSCVVPLTSAYSVGGGSGTPTAGNWLFAIASWTQVPAIAQVHVGVSDDIHSWWRQYPASSASGNVRTSISYTPNIARAAGYVYCAPDAAVAAINVLVVEISGLGPWDTVVGTNKNYAAAATSLALSQNASGQTFFIAGAGGGSTASGQAFAPAGWTALATQTQTNGTDHTCDNILTSAFISSSSNQSVSASASSAEDISGFLLAVKTAGTSPIPATQNTAWPYMVFEMAFGAGFSTPNSELTWTGLPNRLWSWSETTGIQYQLGQLQATDLRFEVDNFDGALTPVTSPWSFTTSGTPLTTSYFIVTTGQSASITAGNGFTDTSNAGTFFTVTAVSAPAFGFVNVSFTPAAGSVMSSPDVVSQASPLPGTPVRLRAALGTYGTQVINRWYVLQRNVHEWEQELTSVWRRWIPASGTDLWSAMSSVPPSFYRAEIYADGPGWWWPMDDQPRQGGVLPTSLLNAAPGSSTVMSILPSPLGVTAQDTYGFNGADVTAVVIAGNFFGVTLPAETTPPAGSVASYAVGTNAGWMYGDPPSSASSISASGNPVQASPGSAAWQQAGLLGAGGSNGWFLSANDAGFPALSGGITVKGWFNAALFGNGSGYAYYQSSWTDTSLCGQPYSPVTICTLATNSAPVAVLQLDISGHLNLITYNGGTGTSHSIYSAADLRNGTWTSVDITLTTSNWNVLLNGGLTANVSGTGAGMTSAWTYLILNADMGTSGGGSTGSVQHGGNIALSHWAVFSSVLPAWRLLAHYTAAITGFGLIPAPAGAGISPVSSPPPDQSTSIGTPTSENDASYQVTQDGAFYSGSYGGTPGSPPTGGRGSVAQYTFSLVTTANAGSYSSGPSARATASGIGQVIAYGAANKFFTWPYALWLSWTGVAPQFTVYTSATAGGEKLLQTVTGDGLSLQSGYGAGASPPAAATPLGDTVGQRIERLMRAGRATSPQRSIDPSAPLVQAPGSTGGGTQAGSSVQAIQQSDSGLLFVDNVGNLTYWMRDHLASQYTAPVWTLTPDAPPAAGAPDTAIPYYEQYRLVTDPQRIWNVITVQPFSPDGAQLPLLTPSNSAGVTASQGSYGAQPYQVTSWLQDQTVMQSQANFLFTNFGQPQTRAENVYVDAAPYPRAWNLVMGINVGDIITLEEWQIGGGGQVLTLRVTEINRKIRFGGQNDGNAGTGEVTGHVELTCDFEPPSYF